MTLMEAISDQLSAISFEEGKQELAYQKERYELHVLGSSHEKALLRKEWEVLKKDFDLYSGLLSKTREERDSLCKKLEEVREWAKDQPETELLYILERREK